jgi:hypothetical protein
MRKTFLPAATSRGDDLLELRAVHHVAAQRELA